METIIKKRQRRNKLETEKKQILKNKINIRNKYQKNILKIEINIFKIETDKKHILYIEQTFLI